MRVLLCSLYDRGASLGIKSIYRVLRKAGHRVKLLFYDTPRFSKKKENPILKPLNVPSYLPPVNQKDVETFQEIIKAENPELIGFSLFSSHYKAAKRLTKEARKVSEAPIIWGGVHAIIDPESCLPHADYVCIGEGEEVILELIQKLENNGLIHSITGILQQDSSQEDLQQERPIIRNLDDLPVEPLDPRDLIFIPRNRPQIIWNLERQGKTPYHSANFTVMASRGCPMSCRYCIHGCLHEQYHMKKGLRKRSAEHVIEEIKMIKRSHPVYSILFMDDFFPMNLDWLERFSELYKKIIRLPFFVYFYPGAIKQQAVDILNNTGLHTANMGIQSGSPRVRKKYYGRPESNTQILDAARLLNPRIHMNYELICDNPYETEDDVRETLDLLLQFPFPFSAMIFSLTFYPNYPITNRAIEDGFIDKNAIYDELDRDITIERRDVNPAIQSLYLLVAATTREEFKRRHLYKWSKNKDLLNHPEKMEKHLLGFL